MTTIALSDFHAETGQMKRGKCVDDFGPRNGAADEALTELVEMPQCERCQEPGSIGSLFAGPARSLHPDVIVESYIVHDGEAHEIPPPPRIITPGEWFELHQDLARVAAHDPTEALDMIFEAHPGISAAWDCIAEDIAGKRRYCRGNHESLIPLGFVYRGVEFVDYAIFEVNGQRVWVEHGHAHDELVARYPRLCRTVTNVVGKLERRWHPDVDVWAQRLFAWLSRTGRHGGNERYWPEVGFAAMEHDCERAVFGHTHQKDWDQGWYGSDATCVVVNNTGTWVNGKRDVTRIEA